MTAIIVISHGSHSPKTKVEVEQLVRKLKQTTPFEIVEYAFLEIEKPSIPEAIKQSVERGAKKIIILLNFLNSGKHVDEDIPKMINAATREYPFVKFQITKPVGQHPKIPELFLDLLKKSLS